MKYSRITIEPDKMDGVPCIRGLRIPVATVGDRIAVGLSDVQNLEYYPDLEPSDIHESLQYATEVIREY